MCRQLKGGGMEISMNCFYPFINTPLPYSYDALMPFIDETTMHLHHDRHLQTYIDNLNALIEANPCLAHYSLEELLTNLRGLPTALQLPVRNQAGGCGLPLPRIRILPSNAASTLS